MGFDREVAIQALISTKGDVNSAAAYCLSFGDTPARAPPPQDAPEGLYGELQEMFDELTQQQRAAVERLIPLCNDPGTALQMYVIANKDEAAARAMFV
jgi:hypothetical protein